MGELDRLGIRNPFTAAVFLSIFFSVLAFITAVILTYTDL